MTKAWCLGFPELSRRVLDAEEIKAMRRERKRWRIKGALALLLALVVPVALFAAAAMVHGPIALFIVALFAWPVIWIAGALVCLDSFRRARYVSRDLRQPEVLHFECTLAEDAVEYASRALKLPSVPTPGPFHFDVMLSTGRLYSVMGARQEHFVILGVQHVAPAPESAETVARWSTMDAELGPAATHVARQRILSPTECDELRSVATRILRRPILLGSFWVFYGILGAYRGFSFFSRTLWDVLYAAGAAAAGLIVAWTIVRGILQARVLRADAREGFVFVTADAGAPTEDGAPLVYEILPTTRGVWSVNGSPAPWRTSSEIVHR